MFTEFANQVWTVSDPAVTVSTTTDYSVDGSSTKIVWVNGEDETATVTFTSVTLANYEEISFYLDQAQLLYADDVVLTVTVGGVIFEVPKMVGPGWKHILINAESLTPSTTIVFKALCPNLIIFIDVLGYRSVGHDRDTDLTLALQDHISLTYGVNTTLSAAVASGATSISLTSWAYINNTTRLSITDGVNTDIVDLTSKTGTLKSAITHSYASGSTVTAICPTLLEEQTGLEPDPVCGIFVRGKRTDKVPARVGVLNGSHLGVKEKQFTGALEILIYIDCFSKKQLLKLARQYDVNYGERFMFLLDGEMVEAYMDNSTFLDKVIGNNPRMSYFYTIDPQPYDITGGTLSGGASGTYTLTPSSLSPELLYFTEVSS